MTSAPTIFTPKPTFGREFVCAICFAHVYAAIAFDCFPVCYMCRWFCSVESRWGRKRDGIA